MKLKVTQRRSAIGRNQRQRDTLRGLGLTRLHQTRELQDTPAIRGMIEKISHLVEVEQVSEK